MATVVLVRHGQTEWNRVERFRGRVDIQLNETGRRQGEALAERLKEEFCVEGIYSSPLSRTMETAGPIARAFGLPIITEDGLVDIDYGQWHGLTPEEAAECFPQEYALWIRSPQLAVIPGGETLSQVRERSSDALLKLARQHASGTIALVSHKVVCKVLACAVLGLDDSHFWRIEQDNAAINVFELRDEVFYIHRLNDTCHLRNRAV